MSTFYRAVPLLGVLAVIYLIVAAVFEGVLDRFVFQNLALPSGRPWSFPVRDLFVVLGLFLLYLEILKSTRTGRGQIVEHIVSMLVFIGCLLLFLLVAKTGSTTFLLITVMSAIDVIAGFTVSIVAARRDLEIERVSSA
jgi:hypothetical protein